MILPGLRHGDVSTGDPHVPGLGKGVLLPEEHQQQTVGSVAELVRQAGSVGDDPGVRGEGDIDNCRSA
jgi:hypothetical protein